jgi:hypothetical protein
MAGDEDSEAQARAQKEKEKQRRDAREAERARFEQLAQDNKRLRAELAKVNEQMKESGAGATGGGSSGDAQEAVPDAAASTLSGDQLVGLLQGIQNTMEGLWTAFRAGQQASGASRPPTPPVERKAAKDILKGKLRALNVRAADMAQEPDAFFRPIESYFQASNLTDMTNADQDAERILILDGTMGEGCVLAMAGTTDADKATYTL